MVNGTLLNFGKRYEDNLGVIFDQWPKLHLGLDSLRNQKILNGIYCTYTTLLAFVILKASSSAALYLLTFACHP